MVKQRVSELFLKGLIISLIFCIPSISLAKDIDIGLPGDSVKILGNSLCLNSSCITDWLSIGGLWSINGTSIYYNTGNVGIGITNPVAALDVYRTEPFRTRGQVVFAGSPYIGSGNRLLMVNNDGNVFATTISAVGLPDSSIPGQTLRSNGTTWVASSNIFNNDTNVGIGTTVPGAKLDVKGATDGILRISTGRNSALDIGALDFWWSGEPHARISVSALGNTSNLHFLVRDGGTSAVEKMTILTSGSVGIGTTTPSQKLHVNGGAQLDAVSYGATPGSSQLSALTTVEFVNAKVTNLLPGGASSTWALSGNNIYNTNSGNVGIGTTAPAERLDLGFNTGAGGNMRLSNYGYWGSLYSSAFQIIGYNAKANTGATANVLVANTNGVVGYSYINLGAEIAFHTKAAPVTAGAVASNEIMRITSGGNVGIGTTTPSQKLHVNGGAQLDAVSYGATPGSSQLSALTTVEFVNAKVTNLLPGGASSTWAINGTHIYNYNSGNVGVGTGAATPNSKLVIKGTGTASTTSALNVTNLANTSALFVRDDGNIGIGTTTPAQKLEIAGAIKIANTSSTCNSDQTGTFRYDSVSGQSYLCDGKRWINQKNCGLMTDFDGNTYGTVQIGGQCWMAENINVGTMLCEGLKGQTTCMETATTSDQIIQKWCYNNDPDFCASEGGLYHWDEAMRGSQVAGAQGICPSGWHVPTDAEYNILEKTVLGVIASQNAQYDCNLSYSGWRRCADDTATDVGANGVGQALKQVGIGSGVGAGTDLVGFSAKLPGYRHTNGSFYSRSSNLYLWSSTPSGSNAWRRYLNSPYSTVYRDAFNKAYGFSVRCLRD